jgi:hypothetical protein
MAYKLSRSKKLVEQIELDNGVILDIDINVGEMSMTFNQEMNKVIKAESLEPTPENLQNLGQIMIDFYKYVLGSENVEMISIVTPFIKKVVTPSIKEYLQGKQDKALLYKKGKKR